MSRMISLTLREAMNAQDTGEILITLLTISHPDFPDSMRLSSDPTQMLSVDPLRYGTVSRGDTFLFAPFSQTFPDDNGERAPTMRLLTENVSRDLVAMIRSVSTRPTALVEVVLASSPDTIEIEYPPMEVVNASYNANVMTVDLSIDGMAEVAYPARTFSPSAFPGLF